MGFHYILNPPRMLGKPQFISFPPTLLINSLIDGHLCNDTLYKGKGTKTINLLQHNHDNFYCLHLPENQILKLVFALQGLLKQTYKIK